MRKMSLCLAILLVAAGSYAGSQTDKPTQRCIEWLLERMAEAKSGMSPDSICKFKLDEPFSAIHQAGLS